jgi:hypothetical protein
LAYSIFKVASRQCDFVISLVAFVHPNVTTSRPTLRKLGFHVIEAPKPINVSAINPAFTFLHKKMDKNGCCGALELIKLNSYRLTQYEWVIHMDADTFFLNPIDELLERPFSLIYTTDPNMATYKAEKSEPAQGGFLVLRPSVDDYKNIINVIMTTGFFEGSGWNRSAIGWFWGGMTVQGVLPFYYNAVTTPGRSQKVDRCIYNSMADTGACEYVCVCGACRGCPSVSPHPPFSCFGFVFVPVSWAGNAPWTRSKAHTSPSARSRGTVTRISSIPCAPNCTNGGLRSAKRPRRFTASRW